MRLFSRDFHVPYLVAGIMLLLAVGLLSPQYAAAKVFRQIEYTEGDPGDGLGSPSSGTIDPIAPLEGESPIVGPRESADGPALDTRLIWFSDSLVLLNPVLRWDNGSPVWTLYLSNLPRLRGGK